MIDLKTKGLPNAIEVNGTPFLLNTDFRIWLSFIERMECLQNGDRSRYSELFSGLPPVPTKAVIEALGAFYSPPREIPRSESVEEPLIDLEIDADYIFAAFMQAYDIDLTEVDMHWHKFTALLSALPAGTVMTDIIGYRGYRGSSKDPEYKEHMKRKAIWALPQKASEEEQAAMEEFNKLFG